MFKDSFLDNVNLQTILDARRTNKDGLFPIKYRITQYRKQFYYSSGLSCSSSDWELIETSKKSNIVALRSELQLGHDAIKENIRIVIENNKGLFSIDKLNNLIKKNVTDTVNVAFKAKIAITKAEGHAGTSSYYQCALNSIESYKDSNIKFHDITPDWLKNYEKHMLKKNSSYTTIGMYCRAIRTIMNEAKKAGIINENDYPFGKGKYEIPSGESRKLALTIDQLGLLIKANADETESKYRDLWYFSYLCNGINIADLCNLKHSDIEDNVIRWYRQKTINTSTKKQKIEAILLPQMEQIIQRWNQIKKSNIYVFPFLNGKETPEEARIKVQSVTRIINRYVKRIANRIGIKEISTYTARHSFATVLKRSGANIAMISESLGHSDLKTTNDYLASFEIDEKRKNALKLIPD